MTVVSHAFLIFLVLFGLDRKAEAIGLARNCGAYLANVVVNGPATARAGFYAWQSSNESVSQKFLIDEDGARRRLDILQIRASERGVRFTGDQNAALLEVARDPLATRTELQDVLAIVRDSPSVTAGAKVLESVRKREDFFDLDLRDAFLRAYLNPGLRASDRLLNSLILNMLVGDTREDVAENDVPWTARLGDPIAALELERRISPETMANAYALIASNPRAGLNSLYWSTGFLNHWARSHYLRARRMPKCSLFQPTFQAYHEALGRFDPARRKRELVLATLRETERMLGCPEQPVSK